jgi:RND family efflux transporter MFP subunit
MGMKKLAIVMLAAIVASCSQPDKKNDIEGQLAQYKKEKNQLEQKISELNQKLDTLGETPASGKGVPVFVQELRPERFSHFVKSNGTVQAVDDAFISPETSGQITTIHVDEGDRVREGALLVSLKTDIIRSNIREVETNLELARKTFEKQKRLWADSVGSEMQYLEAKNRKESLENRLSTLKEQLEMSRIKAPFDGIVEDISQKVGELGTPGVRLLHLVNLKNLKVETEITEEYISNVEEGDTVAIHFPAYPDMVKRVPITRKGSVIDKESRTFTIEARISNPDERIKPNQISVVHVRDYLNPNALTVPSNVIKEDMKGSYLFLAREDQGQPVARKVYIETGQSFNNNTVLTGGAEAGDRVITSGYTQVSDGTRVNIRQKDTLTQ